MHYRQRLKEWIADRDLKQKALAKELGVSESVISNYLTGRTQMTIEMLVKMAEYFGVSVDYLAGVTDDPELPVGLSRTERQLVESFRTLTREQRELIIKNVMIMQEQNRRE